MKQHNETTNENIRKKMSQEAKCTLTLHSNWVDRMGPRYVIFNIQSLSNSASIVFFTAHPITMATEANNPINMNSMSSSLQRTGQWYEPVQSQLYKISPTWFVHNHMKFITCMCVNAGFSHKIFLQMLQLKSEKLISPFTR